MFLKRTFLILLAVCIFSVNLFAQIESTGAEEIEEEVIVTPKILLATEGIVDYDIPDDIYTNLFSKPGLVKKVDKQIKTVKRMSKPKMRQIQGFRIQVFSDGRNQPTLQARAKARGNSIVSRFPKYRGQVYTFSSAPNWYTRIGNFETNAEASAALAELKRAFPAFAGEMRVVKSPIIVIK